MARVKFTFKCLRMDLDEGREESGGATRKESCNFETDEQDKGEEEETSVVDGNSFLNGEEMPMQSLGKRQRSVWELEDLSTPHFDQFLKTQAEKQCEKESFQSQAPLPISRLAAVKTPMDCTSSSLSHLNSVFDINTATNKRGIAMSPTVSVSSCSFDTEKPKVIVMRGDPTDWSTEAIVSGTNSLLHHNCGLAAMIVRKGGLGIQRQSTEWGYYHGEVRVGSAMWTTGGKLATKYVIHTVGPDVSNHRWPTPRHQLDLRRAVRSALKVASDIGVKSVTIPAISTGVSCYPKYLAAREIVAECLQFCSETRSTALRLIVLMNEDQVTASIFAQALKEARQQCQLQRSWADSVHGNLPTFRALLDTSSDRFEAATAQSMRKWSVD